MGKIEDVILSKDKRTISNLRRYCTPDYVTDAAQFILEHPGPMFILTGFWVIYSKLPEVDGPPGGFAVGRAMQELGHEVYYITDELCHNLFTKEEARAKVIDFPITGKEESKKVAQRLLDEYKPATLFAIERPGLTVGGQYRNGWGLDITKWTARLDELFFLHSATVAVGDGGNELGMGALYEAILRVPTLAPFPTTTAADKEIVASVSNWGGYALATALSQLTGKDLLPNEKEEGELITWMAIDQKAPGGPAPGVAGCDGFTVEENLEILRQLRQLL